MIITCVSLNIWYGGKLLPAALDFLRHENADIVLLQEVYDGHDRQLADHLRTMDVLRSELRYPFDNFAPAMIDRHPETDVVQGNAVLSKFPIVASDVTYLNEPFGVRDPFDRAQFPTCPRPLQHVLLALPQDLSLHVYNVHGVWDLDGDNYSDRRRQMSDKMIAAVKGKHPVVLAGDTNARHGNRALRRLERYLPSVFGDSLTTTFNMRHKEDPGYGTAAVDLMYVSPDVKVLSKRCPDVDVSDHLPLVVRLQLTA